MCFAPIMLPVPRASVPIWSSTLLVERILVSFERLGFTLLSEKSSGQRGCRGVGGICAMYSGVVL